MTLVRPALIRIVRSFGTVLAGAALVAACSTSTSSLSTAAPSREAGPIGAAATPTPAPTIGPSVAAAATPAPSVAALPPELNAGTPGACDPTDTGKHCETPGTYRLTGGPDVWPVLVTMDVPAGWFEPEPGTGFDLV